jgi:MFS family permease
MIPAIPDLVRGLHASSAEVAWMLTGFFLSAAVFTPILGRLGDMFGRRRMTNVAALAFFAGAVIVATTSNVWVAVVGRVVQGVGGALFPLCFSILRDLAPPQQTARNVGLLSATNGVGSVLGLVVGGLIASSLSYHWIFWLSAAMALAGAVLIHWLVPESGARSGGSVDIRGAVVLAIGLVIPLFAISRASSWGWVNGRTLGLIVAGLIVLAVWVRIEQRTEEPLANIASLGSGRVLMTNVATIFVGYSIVALFLLLPQLSEAPRSTGYGLGLSASGAGLVMLPGALVMMFFGAVSGSLGARFTQKLPLISGGVLVMTGFLLLVLAHRTRFELLAFGAIMSGGVGLAFAASANLIIESADRLQTAEATGFNGVFLRVGMSIGAQVPASILAASATTGAVVASSGGYTDAFAVSAALALAGTVVAILIPRSARRSHSLRSTEAGAANDASDRLAAPSRAAERGRAGLR